MKPLKWLDIDHQLCVYMLMYIIYIVSHHRHQLLTEDSRTITFPRKFKQHTILHQFWLDLSVPVVLKLQAELWWSSAFHLYCLSVFNRPDIADGIPSQPTDRPYIFCYFKWGQNTFQLWYILFIAQNFLPLCQDNDWMSKVSYAKCKLHKKILKSILINILNCGYILWYLIRSLLTPIHHLLCNGWHYHEQLFINSMTIGFWQLMNLFHVDIFYKSRAFYGAILAF